jgi:hypothetical protein
MDLFDHLQRQVNFIRHSCDSYDRGFRDEAIRIAQQVRVLVHKTQKSTSLLTQLNATHIRLLTTVPPVSERTVFWDGMSLMTATGKETGVCVKVDAALGGGPFQKLFPADAWWNQLIYIRNDIKVSRKSLALTAANKDGGAHVDPQLTPEYQELTQGLWTTVSESAETSVPDSQFYFLRQIGYEVLHSPDLQQLAASRTIPPFVPTPPADLQPERIQPLQRGATDLGMSEQEFASFVTMCRGVVTKPHYELLWNLFESSPGAMTNPLGNYEKAVAAGYSLTMSDWLSPLLGIGLLEARVCTLPRGGEQTMYALGERGRAFVTAVLRSGG